MGTKAPPGDVSRADVSSVIDEVLLTNSDRAAVIAAVALIDSQLRNLVGKRGKLSELIEKSLKRGLIDQETHDALDIARDLRNDFAHEWLPPKLTDPEVATKVEALATATLTTATSSHFTLSDQARLSCLALALAVRIAKHSGNGRLTLAGVRDAAARTVERARVVTEDGDQIVTNDGEPITTTQPLTDALESGSIEP